MHTVNTGLIDKIKQSLRWYSAIACGCCVLRSIANIYHIVCYLDWKRFFFFGNFMLFSKTIWWITDSNQHENLTETLSVTKWLEFSSNSVFCRMPCASILRWIWSAAVSMYPPSTHTFWTCRKLKKKSSAIKWELPIGLCSSIFSVLWTETERPREHYFQPFCTCSDGMVIDYIWNV